jgi:hypothetical protein
VSYIFMIKNLRWMEISLHLSSFRFIWMDRYIYVSVGFTGTLLDIYMQTYDSYYLCVLLPKVHSWSCMNLGKN